MKKTLLLVLGNVLMLHAESLSLDMRVQIADTNLLQCTITNTTTQSQQFNPYLSTDGNRHSSISLSSPIRLSLPFGIFLDLLGPKEVTLLALPSFHGFVSYVKATDINLDSCVGEYSLFSWQVKNCTSQPLTVGLLSNDTPLRPLVVAEESAGVETFLAYVYNKDAPAAPELGFLFLNGTNVPVTVTQPLFNDSRLIITAPSVNYSNELFTVDNTATNAVVEPRAVAEWRVPWHSAYARLPAADRARLEAAGNVDLYWQCGEYLSPVLPVFLKPATP